MKVEKVFEEVEKKVVKMKIYSPDELIQRGFKGVWIPKEIWLAEDISWIEKLFLTEINSLDNNDGCFASNSHFSKFFHMSTNRCSEIITSLQQKNYVNIDYLKDGKQIVKRIVKIIKNGIRETEKPIRKTEAGTRNSEAPYSEKGEGINTLINNTVSNTINKNLLSDLSDEIESVYKLYPTTCPTRGVSNHKSSKDKMTIKSLLKKHTAEELKELITLYVNECAHRRIYMKNFKTFLSNLPDRSSFGPAYQSQIKSNEDLIV